MNGALISSVDLALAESRGAARERARIRRVQAKALARLRVHAEEQLCFSCIKDCVVIFVATRPEPKRKKAKGTK